MERIATGIYSNFPLYFLAIGLILYISLSKIKRHNDKLIITLIVITCVISSICSIITSFCHEYYNYFNDLAFPTYPTIAIYVKENNLIINDYLPLEYIVSAFTYITKAGVFYLLWVLILKERKRKIITINLIVLIVYSIICFTTPFTKLICYFDYDNYYYHDGYLHILVFIIPIYYGILISIEAIRCYIKNDFKQLLFIIFLAICVLSSTILESILSDETEIYILDLTIIGCCIFYYLFIHSSTMLENIEDVELKLETKDAELKLSQINPHFIFNTLNSIIDICEDDSKEQKALVSFSKYLRVNLDVLSSNKPITFKQELGHIKTYANLESLRFENKINMTYNIEDDNFLIPALSIQPLIENSIKYGVLSKGKVDILVQTIVKEREYIITIADNGPGFDENAIKNDGKHHIGLENVKYRLKKMVNARVEIKSVVSEGTTINVRIPR